ncbi:MAG: nuclear transport factor 2 family protein [Bacteroidota bacterium]|nr:nuclear transport factor 2 family protein [Flavisolibacter sp.]MDQ3842460.1 nuclear transport factor 2 family protein [Bacteroidota bacterium]
MRELFLFIASFCFLGLSAQTLHDQKIQKQLDAFMEQFMQAYNKADANALAELYEENATYIGTAGDITQGRDKLRAGFKNSLPYFKNFVLTPSETGGNRKLIYQNGVYSQKLSIPNKSEEIYTGKYLVVLRRVARNAWRIQKQMVSRDRS